MIRSVILDDESKGSSLLEYKINSCCDDILVQRIFNDPIEALNEINDIQPDVLFLDVEMPKLNGFQFLEKMGSFDFEP